MNKNNEIQMLRAVAVLCTMLEHVTVLTDKLAPVRVYLGFWSGVDIFFVISGYVITRSLYPFLDSVDGGAQSHVHLKVFWCKRIFRILPAAWLWIAITLGIAGEFQGNTVFPSFYTTVRDACAAFLNFANFHWAACWTQGGFGKFCSAPTILAYYWSLSLEEQFYLIFPLSLIFIRGRIRMTALILALIYLATVPRGALGWGWHARVDGLLWGVLFALYFRNHAVPNIQSHRIIFLLRCLPIVLIFSILWWAGAGVDWYIARRGFPVFWLSLLACLSALLVLLAIQEKRLIWLPHPLEKVFVHLGELSYGLYLVHYPSYALIKSLIVGFEIGEKNIVTSLEVLAGFALSYIFALCTFLWVERPCRAFGIRAAGSLVANGDAAVPAGSIQ